MKKCVIVYNPNSGKKKKTFANKAFKEGEKDDFIETDMKYETFSPSLCEYLQEYVEKNKDCIFD